MRYQANCLLELWTGKATQRQLRGVRHPVSRTGSDAKEMDERWAVKRTPVGYFRRCCLTLPQNKQTQLMVLKAVPASTSGNPSNDAV